MPEPETGCDVLIVGAGILGLACARQWQEAHPGASIIVLEKEPRTAQHQTSHNSGVIHTGLYYQPGSLKARLAVEGGRAMKTFCQQHDLPVLETGKVVVAVHEQELPWLQSLYERAEANGVRGLEMIDAAELRNREPLAAGLQAMWVPEAAVVDYKQVADTLAQEFQNAGGCLRLQESFQSASRQAGRWQVKTSSTIIESDFLLTCGGLHSDRIVAACGLQPSVSIIPFRGEYYSLREDMAARLQRLLYPVPDPAFPFLGVHLTPGLDATAEAGPNAVLSMSREGYNRLSWSTRDVIEMAKQAGFWKLLSRTWQIGLREQLRSWSKTRFLKALQILVPEIQKQHLTTYTSGVRAQAIDHDGTLVDDFIFQEDDHALHVLNAPSPAATASLAIAKEIVRKTSMK